MRIFDDAWDGRRVAGADALPADGAAALACAFAAHLGMAVPARVETLPLLAMMGDAA